MSISQAERLARIEALLETGSTQNGNILAEISALKVELEKVKTELTADKADLAQLKNRGAGILIGIALLGAVVGAKARAMLEALGSALN